jgi:hypothetical protein
MVVSDAVQGQRVINPYESRWFWIVLVANPVVWALSCLSALLGLDWGESPGLTVTQSQRVCDRHCQCNAGEGTKAAAPPAGSVHVLNISVSSLDT